MRKTGNNRHKPNRVHPPLGYSHRQCTHKHIHARCPTLPNDPQGFAYVWKYWHACHWKGISWESFAHAAAPQGGHQIEYPGYYSPTHDWLQIEYWTNVSPTVMCVKYNSQNDWFLPSFLSCCWTNMNILRQPYGQWQSLIYQTDSCAATKPNISDCSRLTTYQTDSRAATKPKQTAKSNII